MSESRRETSGHFRSVFDASAIGIALVGRSGRIERCNPALARMLGHAASALQGRDIADLAVIDESAALARGLDEILAGTRSAFHGERAFRHADGRVVWARLAVTPVRQSDGGISGVLVMAEDISAEHAAKAERDRIHAELVERVKEATALHAASRILLDGGMTLDETLQRIVDLLPPAFHFESITEARITLGDREARTPGYRDMPRRIHSRFTLHDGTHGTIEVVLTDAPPAGQPDWLEEERRLIESIATSLALAVDRRRTMQALQRSEERLQVTIAAARVGTWEWDLTTDRVTWSTELELLAGLAPGTFGGTLAAYSALVHPDDRTVVRESIGRAIADPSLGDAFESEFRFRLPDGSHRWCLSRGRVLRDASGRPSRMLGLAHDISSVRTLQQQFEQAQKMEALGRLAGGVAHDFNNLLTVMRGCVEFIGSELAPGHPSVPDLRELSAATDRAEALTRQLLAFSRTQAVDRRLVDPNQVVTGMDKMLRRLIGQHIESVLDLEDAVGMVRMDAGQLEQVIMNLAVNARDAMPDGGRLTIQTRRIEFEDRLTLRDFSLAIGRYVVIQVSDTGTGMSAEVQERLFEAFFTTKDVGRGTGLGLATVHGIVKQAGGAIFVYSEVGQGSVFKVYLPWQGDEPERREPASAASAGLTGTERVLLVDDDESVRALAKRALDGAGYEVHPHGNPVEALALLKADAVPFDLLVTDVVMPRMQGTELAKAFLAANPRGRVLFVTGFTDRPIDLDQPTQLLPKPFAPSALLRAVRDLLDREIQAPGTEGATPG